MPSDLEMQYSQLLQRAGNDPGEAFTLSEIARREQGNNPESVQLNRFAQSYDTPATALLAAPYEGMKWAEQKTGIPVLTGAAKLTNALGIPTAPPRAGSTSDASLGNATASIKGALARLKALSRRLTGDEVNVQQLQKGSGKPHDYSEDFPVRPNEGGWQRGVDLTKPAHRGAMDSAVPRKPEK